MPAQNRTQRPEVPYLNNLHMAALVVLINLPLAFLFQYGRPLTVKDLLTDAAICGWTTALISLWLAKRAVGARRGKGTLPAQVPCSRLMQKLPRNLFSLSFAAGIPVAALMWLITLVLLRFFPDTAYTFERFLVWKLSYATLLALRIIALGVFRFVQPDCQSPADPPQTGLQTVKNPLPRRDMLLRLYQSVTADFGMNLLLGLALGGTLIRGNEVVLMPVYQSNVWISGLILGMILTLLMVRPTLAADRQLALEGALPPVEKQRRMLLPFPENPCLFSAVLLVPVVIVSSASIYGILRFFGFHTLNFFQYFIVRTLYAKLLAKPIESLAVLRYRQLPRSLKR